MIPTSSIAVTILGLSSLFGMSNAFASEGEGVPERATCQSGAAIEIAESQNNGSLKITFCDVNQDAPIDCELLADIVSRQDNGETIKINDIDTGTSINDLREASRQKSALRPCPHA